MVRRLNHLMFGTSVIALALASASGAFAQSRAAETPVSTGNTSAVLGTAALAASQSVAMLEQAAPAPADAGANGGAIVVTATRLQNGFSAPTPTTVLGTADIQAQAQPNIFETITELPSLAGSTGIQSGNNTTSTGNTALSSFSIHNLGTIRTLTLFDGQRVVPAFSTGVNDISQFPQLLIQRVDVVTGGASASYGSDAIGGVVNFVTDKNFDGFKANVEGGESNYGDNKTGLISIAAGTHFMGGKGHIEASVDFEDDGGIGPGNYGTGCQAGQGGRCYFQEGNILAYTLTNTPPGSPMELVEPQTQDIALAKYGVITSGPLINTQFNAAGQPQPFQLGSPCIGSFCGPGGDTSGDIGGTTSLEAKLQRVNLYIRPSYDLTENINVWATLMASNVLSSNVPIEGAFRPNDLTIQCGNAAGGPNAYLPASINQACINDNITSFGFGTTNVNMPNTTVKNDRSLLRVTAGADAKFDVLGNPWTASAYIADGVNHELVRATAEFIVPYYNFAIDAINLNGQIVCRNAAARAAGCVPINSFGNVVPSQAAINYIYGIGAGGAPTQNTWQWEQAGEISFAGNVVNDWAGPISSAFGAAWRQEGYDVAGDPIGNGGFPQSEYPLLSTAGNNYFAGNYHTAGGQYQVSEIFGELGVPLLNMPPFGKLDVDLAGRETDYSTFGWVSTWKLGFTYDTPVDGVRIRALQSRDIRAPNLSEIFSAPSTSNNVATNPWQGGVQNNIILDALGNSALKPEVSINTELGLVFQPSWLPGFHASVDYYQVEVKNEVGSVAFQTAVNFCYEGLTSYCSAIEPAVSNPAQYATTNFTLIKSEVFNIASLKDSGLDIEASYQFKPTFMPGRIILHALANNVINYTSNSGLPGAVVFNAAGQDGGSTPSWRLYGVETWQMDRWTVNLTERWISAGTLQNNAIVCTTGCPAPTSANPTINENSVPAIFYLDVGGTYNLTNNTQVYFKINNIGNQLSPIIPSTTTPNALDVNQSLYDMVGRMYYVGVRLNY